MVQKRHSAAIPATTFKTSLVLGVLLAAASVSSFYTVESDIIGQHSEHERITRLALACPPGAASTRDCFEPLSLNQLAGDRRTFGGVGAPDTPPPEGPEAHCDDADFFDSSDYPQSREDATEVLQKCVTHLRGRMKEGLAEAELMLNDKNQIVKGQVNVDSDCIFGPISVKGRAKCNTLEGLGRALHGVQDFYSHSNWADTAEPPFTPENPPGLELTEPAPLLDLRSRAPISVPRDLSTGCFAGPLVDMTPGFLTCSGRVTHNTLNKDGGMINLESGNTTSPFTDRGKIGNNFGRAVEVAVKDTQRQWQHFRSELRSKYGPVRAGLMICALTSDDPAQSCQGRKLAVVLDSSRFNADIDPENLRTAAAKGFIDMLHNQEQAGDDSIPDLVTVVGFRDAAKVIYPLGDPSIAGIALDGIDAHGESSVASGLGAAIDELAKGAHGLVGTAHKSGIVVFTSSADEDTKRLVNQVSRARALGIRVALGHLSPPSPKREDPPASLLDLATAVLDTRGLYAEIDTPRALTNFVEMFVAHGPTDHDDGGGAGSGMALLPGLTVFIPAASSHPSIFTYTARAGEKLGFSIHALGTEYLNSTLWDVRSATALDVEETTDSHGRVTISVDVVTKLELELSVHAKDPGMFSVGLESSVWSGQLKRKPTMSYPNATCPHVVKTITVLYVSRTFPDSGYTADDDGYIQNGKDNISMSSHSGIGNDGKRSRTPTANVEFHAEAEITDHPSTGRTNRAGTEIANHPGT
ncbi:hypothetical protein BZA05DRAFT_64490 [Tricharina praecox]|uniref:uncharacterized protein n=1 Tax=Tricharina praecox TaxID=43433 RepID=UPI0022210377|nr:uncharacterized protein BZA05DRAFT_64490 [Tricharina praecox]KAI5849968.1 hypothetical protein BZA05DRAFT_64490 [Tricharina praecox]